MQLDQSWSRQTVAARISCAVRDTASKVPRELWAVSCHLSSGLPFAPGLWAPLKSWALAFFPAWHPNPLGTWTLTNTACFTLSPPREGTLILDLPPLK